MVASNSLLLVALTAATAFASQPTPGSQIQTQYFHDQPAIESHEGTIQQRDPQRLSGSLSDLRSPNHCDGCSAPQFEQENFKNYKRELRYPLRMGDRPIVEARQYGFDDAYQFHNQKRHVPYLMEKHELSEELVQPQDGAENSDKEKRMVMLPPGSPGYERQSKFIEEATKKGLAIAKRVVISPSSPNYEQEMKSIGEAEKKGMIIAKREPSPEPEDFNKREDASESITKPSWTGTAFLENKPLTQNLPTEQKQGNEKRELEARVDWHNIALTGCSGVVGTCDGWTGV